MSNHRYNPEPYIQDALTQITSDIRHAANTNNPRYLADKAEDIARFAQALATITLHQYNIILDPRLADNEEYMRIVCAGYSVELSNWSAPLEVNTRIHVADKKTRNEINLRNRKVKHMQVTGYDITTQTHELTFTLKSTPKNRHGNLHQLPRNRYPRKPALDRNHPLPLQQLCHTQSLRQEHPRPPH
jgi:hypothetical protein